MGRVFSGFNLAFGLLQAGVVLRFGQGFAFGGVTYRHFIVQELIDLLQKGFSGDAHNLLHHAEFCCLDVHAYKDNDGVCC